MREDDYLVDSTTFPQIVLNLRNLSIEDLEDFFEGTVPKRLLLTQK